MSIAIAVETPLSDDVRRLVEALNEAALKLTPREFSHHLTVEQMAGSDMTVFVARDEGRAVAMGSLRRHPGGVGEVKRMYTMPQYQGRGIGKQILAEIESLARRERLNALALETGNNFDAALRLYRGAGFEACDPLLDYPPSPYSAFFRKSLSIGVPA